MDELALFVVLVMTLPVWVGLGVVVTAAVLAPFVWIATLADWLRRGRWESER